MIRCLVLKYSKEASAIVSKLNYQEELDFLVSYPERNKYICNLVNGLAGNTLILFQLVEKHGNILHSMLQDILDVSTRKLFYVYGGTDAESREQVRSIVEGEPNAVICASYGVYSTGVNIRNLHNIIFASPSKSKIRNLQSIGRGLRIGEGKESVVLYDIADDLSWKKNTNYTLNHFSERINTYSKENFNYEIHSVRIPKCRT